MDNKEAENILRVFCDKMRSRIVEFVHWHRSHGSDADNGKLFEIGSKYEEERLERLAEKAETEGQGDLADLWRVVKEELLPKVVHDLKFGQ